MIFESPEFNQTDLSKPEYLIDIFKQSLTEIEAEQISAELNLEDQASIKELTESFETEGEIGTEIERFFEMFFVLIQQIPYILEVKTVIKNFEEGLKAYKRLVISIQESNHIDTETLLEFIEEYGLTLENRLVAIQREQDFINKHLPQAIKASIEVDLKNKSLILSSQEMPGPLIGMTELLNYQIKQIIEINKLIYDEIEQEMQKHKLEKICIKPIEKISSESLEEFTFQLDSDKADIQRIQNQDSISDEDNELIYDIAAELATNLVYRLYWSKPEFCTVF